MKKGIRYASNERLEERWYPAYEKDIICGSHDPTSAGAKGIR